MDVVERLAVEGDDGAVMVSLGVQCLADAPADGVLLAAQVKRRDQIKIDVRMLGSAHHAEIVERKARVDGVDNALHALTDGGKAVATVLMLIGGSSGSTAGGVKTVTMVVLLLFIAARARGKETVCVFKRTIPSSQVMDAMTIITILVGLAMFGSIFICATSPFTFVDALFESVSALATVGLTAGGTPLLSVPAQILIIIYMYFGRVGVLTIALGFLMGNKAQERFQYAQTKLLIG